MAQVGWAWASSPIGSHAHCSVHLCTPACGFLTVPLTAVIVRPALLPCPPCLPARRTSLALPPSCRGAPWRRSSACTMQSRCDRLPASTAVCCIVLVDSLIVWVFWVVLWSCLAAPRTHLHSSLFHPPPHLLLPSFFPPAPPCPAPPCPAAAHRRVLPDPPQVPAAQAARADGEQQEPAGLWQLHGNAQPGG